jgi:penicillin-binding protein 2
VVEGARYTTMAESNRINARLIAPAARPVLDRNGEVMGGNRINWRALLVAEQTGDLAATLDNFSRIVALTEPSAPASTASCAATAASCRSCCASS